MRLLVTFNRRQRGQTILLERERIRHYDDGGISGGTMERPALQELLSDIRAGKIDVVVVYKIDRLTRSLMDFARIVEVFDAQKVSFVSVTQQFNTLSSMGRLTLNVLVSVAQFEREGTAERIRDKIAASKQKGMWMGGVVPHGYRVEDRKLIIEGAEAKEVQLIFELYSQLKSIPALIRELDARGIRDKGSEACVWCQRRRHSIHHRHRRPAAGEPGLPRGDQSPGQELPRRA